jgi:hypothetical protein
MVELKIVIAGGPLIGKDPFLKKFPENTNIAALKAVVAKLSKIPI